MFPGRPVRVRPIQRVSAGDPRARRAGAPCGWWPVVPPLPRGPATVWVVLVSDLRHYDDVDGTTPPATVRLAGQLRAIVRAASCRPIGFGSVTAVECTRRPGRRPCVGYIMVFHRRNGTIAWSCDTCGDEGEIVGWQDSPFDLSALDDVVVDGEPVAVLIDRELASTLRDVLLLDTASEVLVARAEGRRDGVVVHGGRVAFDELIDAIAAESNHTDDRRLQRRLDAAVDALESGLAGP